MVGAWRLLKFLVLLLLALQAGCSSAAASSLVDGDFDGLYKEAVRHLDAGDRVSCMATLRKCHALQPANYEVLQLLGTLLLDSQQAAEGSTLLGEAVALSQGADPSTVANYVEALRLSGQVHEAIRVGTSFHAQHPSNSQLAFNLALSLETASDLDAAAALFTHVATTLAPSLKAAHERASICLLRAGRFQAAELLLSASVQRFPSDYRFHYQLGLAVHKQERFAPALLHYAAAEALEPNDLDVQSNIGAAYHAMGEVELALGRYLSILPRRPGDAGLLNNLGPSLTLSVSPSACVCVCLSFSLSLFYVCVSFCPGSGSVVPGSVLVSVPVSVCVSLSF